MWQNSDLGLYHLLEQYQTRAELNQLLEKLGMDTLLTSDWTKMENLVKLFEPFVIHIDQLHSDSQSLSQVVPCLLNLEAHLLTSRFRNPLAQVLLKSLRERFAGILNPDSTQFDATPAGACCWIQMFHWFFSHQIQHRRWKQQSSLCRTWQLSITQALLLRMMLTLQSPLKL